MGFIGGALGAIAGSQPNQTTGTYTVSPGAMLQGEQQGLDLQGQSLSNLQGLVGAGPGQSAITNALNNSNSLAGMFAQYSQTGGAPTAAMQGVANNYAAQAFAPQQTALQQSFLQSNYNEQRMAGMLGRPVNDPTLQAKLQIGEQQQQALLNAQQGSFGSQYAQQLSQNALKYATGQNQILTGLASQALQNQAQLLGYGSQVANQGLNWQLQTATRTGNEQSGGGLAGAINGFMGGMGMGMQANNLAQQGGGWGNAMGFNQLGSMFGGGGGATLAPASAAGFAGSSDLMGMGYGAAMLA